MGIWRQRAKKLGVLLAVEAVSITIIAALAYLILGWQGVAAAFLGLVVGVVMVIWLLVTRRLRWPPV
jgi:hypothetical protein